MAEINTIVNDWDLTSEPFGSCKIPMSTSRLKLLTDYFGSKFPGHQVFNNFTSNGLIAVKKYWKVDGINITINISNSELYLGSAQSMPVDTYARFDFIDNIITVNQIVHNVGHKLYHKLHHKFDHNGTSTNDTTDTNANADADNTNENAHEHCRNFLMIHIQKELDCACDYVLSNNPKISYKPPRYMKISFFDKR